MALFRFFKREKPIDICRKWNEWKNKIENPKARLIIQNLCEEGEVEVNGNRIRLEGEKAVIETFDEVIEVENARELVEIVKDCL